MTILIPHRLSCVVVGATLLAAANAAATTWPITAPVTPEAIQAIADGAASGDTLHFAAGTYEAAILVQSKSLTFTGDGADRTVLTRTLPDVQFRPGILRVMGDGGAPIRVVGLAFESGHSAKLGESGAITTRQAGIVQLYDCRFGDNRATGSTGSLPNAGGAVSVTGAHLVQVVRCEFERNVADAPAGMDASGGAMLLAGQEIEILSCRFAGNGAFGTGCGGQGGAVNMAGNLLTVTDGEFLDNSAVAGAALASSGSLLMMDCRFRGNTTATSACGAPASTTAHIGGLDIRRTAWVANAGAGAALRVTGDGPVTLDESTMAFNGASGGRPALDLDLEGTMPTVRLRRNLVARNHGPGIGPSPAAGINVACNIVWANAPDFPFGVDFRGAFDNQASDPLFCTGGLPDNLVAANSPCFADGAGHPAACATIGVVTAGCPAVSVSAATWSAIKVRFGAR